MGEHPNPPSVTHATADGIPADGGQPVPAWRAWTVGTRVVVRRRLPEGGLGDVLGDLLEVESDGVVVGTRRGPVPVAAADIVLGKPVPPPPAGRAQRAPRGAAGSASPAGTAGPGPADA